VKRVLGESVKRGSVTKTNGIAVAGHRKKRWCVPKSWNFPLFRYRNSDIMKEIGAWTPEKPQKR